MQTLFNKLASSGITPNGFYVLYAKFKNINHHNYVNFFHEQHKLQLQGFLKASCKNHKTIYTILPKGLELISEVEDLFNGMNKAKTPKFKYEDWEERIKEYNHLFPKGKKQGSSVSYRTNPKELFTRFKWFFSEYSEYSWEEVMEATRRYIKVYEDLGDNTFLQTSKYFIKKQDVNRIITSNMATMCYNIAEGNDIDANDGTFYFGDK